MVHGWRRIVLIKITTCVCCSYYKHYAMCLYAEIKPRCSRAAAEYVLTYLLNGWQPYTYSTRHCHLGKLTLVIICPQNKRNKACKIFVFHHRSIRCFTVWTDYMYLILWLHALWFLGYSRIFVGYNNKHTVSENVGLDRFCFYDNFGKCGPINFHNFSPLNAKMNCGGSWNF